MLTLLLVWAPLFSYCYSAPLLDGRTARTHIHKHKHTKSETRALKAANTAAVLRYVIKSMCIESKRKKCSAKCCSKRCKTEKTDDNLVSCADLHRMIVELKERIASRQEAEKSCMQAEKSDTVNNAKETPCNEQSAEMHSTENAAGNSCQCGNDTMETPCSADCPPTVYDDCGECKNETRGEFDNCGDECECCDGNACDCNEDPPEEEGEYKEWKCLHDESEVGQDNIRNPPIDDSLICNQKSSIDTHEHHHYHHHQPCCISVNHKHVNIHHHHHDHHHCHCIGCPCRYNNYKCTPLKPKEGGDGGDCCEGVQRDTTNTTTDATNDTSINNTANDETHVNNTVAEGSEGDAPADNANNLLRCTSIYHMLDELKGEISAQANASSISDKAGEARCIIFKVKGHGMWACNDEMGHDHKRYKHKIKKFYGDGKKKKHMRIIRKALRQFLAAWLHPSHKRKSSMH